MIRASTDAVEGRYLKPMWAKKNNTLGTSVKSGHVR